MKTSTSSACIQIRQVSYSESHSSTSVTKTQYPKWLTNKLHTPSIWRYSPGWALASAKICLQVSRLLALSLHSFIPIFLRFTDTSSIHLILGLPLRLVAYSFPYSIFFGISVSCILSICPSHRILWHLIILTMFSPLIMASNSSRFLSLVHIFRKIFLPNTNKLHTCKVNLPLPPCH